MAKDFKGRHLLSIADLDREEVEKVFHTAALLKAEVKVGKRQDIMKGKILGMLFEKSSTRTRISFEVAALQLGGHAIYLASDNLQIKRGESIPDTARVFGRYMDVIMGRVYSHKTLQELAAHAGIPVINGLCDLEHPCQALGDLFTIKEKLQNLNGVKMVYIGDGNNVCHSLMLAGAICGMKVVACTPEGYEPKAEFVKQAKALAKIYGGEIVLEKDPKKAVANADVVYTDVWTSMGDEGQEAVRKAKFKAYQVNDKLLKEAKPSVMVMHCLPAHRGEEITDEVMDGPHSIVFDQAENRLHIQKAVLALFSW